MVGGKVLVSRPSCYQPSGLLVSCSKVGPVSSVWKWVLIRAVDTTAVPRFVVDSPIPVATPHLLICESVALLRDCVVQVWVLTGLLAYPRASVSAISFPLMPSCPVMHCVFPSFASHVFASSRNLINVAWLDPFGIFPAFCATLRLSRHR